MGVNLVLCCCLQVFHDAMDAVAFCLQVRRC